MIPGSDQCPCNHLFGKATFRPSGCCMQSALIPPNMHMMNFTQSPQQVVKSTSKVIVRILMSKSKLRQRDLGYHATLEQFRLPNLESHFKILHA